MQEPGLATLPGLTAGDVVRSVTTPEFAGVTFHEVLARSALNSVAPGAKVPFMWTINPYRGCTHACVYCFARTSHRYLDMDAGVDFDSQIIVKVNVVDVLRRELADPSWARQRVALGTNTDPYQRAEGRYRLMPGIIEALAESGTPISILTKGSLVRRDLPLLTQVAQQVPVELSFSVAIADGELQTLLEPGAPTARARLATVAAFVAAGFDVAVYMMPILPFLTDSEEALDEALSQISAAGVTRVSHTALHLRPGVKEWFARWLNTHRPELTDRYRELYGDGAYVPREYRRRVAARIQPLMDARGMTSATAERSRPAPEPEASTTAAPPPTLF